MDWQFTEDRPIWQQLTDQLALRILKGEYPPGERLPGVRELAAQAGVNPNTMQRAMARFSAAAQLLQRFQTDAHRRPGPGLGRRLADPTFLHINLCAGKYF